MHQQYTLPPASWLRTRPGLTLYLATAVPPDQKPDEHFTANPIESMDTWNTTDVVRTAQCLQSFSNNFEVIYQESEFHSNECIDREDEYKKLNEFIDDFLTLHAARIMGMLRDLSDGDWLHMLSAKNLDSFQTYYRATARLLCPFLCDMMYEICRIKNALSLTLEQNGCLGENNAAPFPMRENAHIQI